MGSKVKQKHLLMLQRKLEEKKRSLLDQRDVLMSTVSDFVHQAEMRADQLLRSESHVLMEQYLDVMQELDRCGNTCMLLTASAEDMMEGSQGSSDEMGRSEVPRPPDPHKADSLNASILSSCPGFDKDNDPEPRKSMDFSSEEREPESSVGSDRRNSAVTLDSCGQVHWGNSRKSSLNIESDDPLLLKDAKGDHPKHWENSRKSSLNIESDDPLLFKDTEGDHPKHWENSRKSSLNIESDDPLLLKDTKGDHLKHELESKVDDSYLTCKSVLSPPADFRDACNLNVSDVPKDCLSSESSRDEFSPVKAPKGDYSVEIDCKGDNSSSKSILKGHSDFPTVKRKVSIDSVTDHLEICPKYESVQSASPEKTSVKEIEKCDPDEAVPQCIPDKQVKTDTAEKMIDTRIKPMIPDVNQGPIISHCTMTEGSIMAVIVSEICTPWTFYVQPYGMDLDRLRNEINFFQSNVKEGEFTISAPKAGLVCLARFTDEQYYRAKVIRVTGAAGEEMCDVIYVDYGNCESVPTCHLLQLPPRLATLASQAIFCSLSGVSPLNKLGVWTEDEINGFRSQVYGKQLNCKAVYVSSRSSLSFPHLVELTLSVPIQQMDVNVGRILISQVSLAAILIKLNLARPIGVSEQIAKLQNQFGEISPQSSKSASPLKQPKSPNCKKEKEPDVVVESVEIVEKKDDIKEKGTKRTTGEEEQTSNKSDKVATPEASSQKNASDDKAGSSLPLDGGATKTVEESSGNVSPTKSSYLEGETTTSGITDMSTIPMTTEEYDVMIAHIETPHDFYIHKITEDVGKTLDRLMKDLNLHFERIPRKKLNKMVSNFKIEQNALCCAQCSIDKRFYRAQIIEIRDSGKKMDVFYMDFGDTETLQQSKVFPLPEEFTCYPPLTIWCSLAHVDPVKHDWSDASIDKFTQLAGNEKKLSLCVIEGQVPDGNMHVAQTSPLKVYLVDVVNSEEEICINLELIRTGHASLAVSKDSSDDSDDDPVNMEWKHKTWDPLLEDYISIRNSYNIDIDDAGVATVGYKAKDEQRICKFYNKNTCWRGQYCPYLHVNESSGITGDQEEVFFLKDDQSEILPDEGTMVAVEITSILSPRHFYLTLPFGKTPIDELQPKQADDNDHEENLEDLVRSMNANYMNTAFSHRDFTLLAPGQVVAARYTNDSWVGWYRAKVTDLSPEEEKVEVVFVDFGHTEWVTEKDVHNLEPEFLHLPQQAIECFLVDIQPRGQDVQWSEEARNKFRVMVDGKTLVAQIRTKSCSGCLHVDLYDTTGRSDLNIAQELIRQGFAERCDQKAPVAVRPRFDPSEVILVPG